MSSPPSLFPCCCVKNSIVLCQKIISHETPQPTDFRSVSIYLEWRRQMNHPFMLQPCICHLQYAGILFQTNMHHTNSVENRYIVSGNFVTDVDSRLPQFFFCSVPSVLGTVFWHHISYQSVPSLHESHTKCLISFCFRNFFQPIIHSFFQHIFVLTNFFF